MTIKHCAVILLAAAPVAAPFAQDWSELQTITFVPVSLGRSQESAAGSGIGASEGSSGNAREASAAPAQEPSAEFILARIEAAVASVESEQAAKGENAPEVVPPLVTLAGIYQEINDYAGALAALEQAQQIIRRWDGLYSLEQAGLIERMIEIRMDVMPTGEAEELESYLRELVQRNPGDPRNVSILMDMADRQMEVVRYVLVNGLPPAFNLNIDPGFGPDPRRFAPPRTTRSVAASTLRSARSSYRSAMNEALSKQSAEIPVLLELEDNIIDTYYFELMNPELRRRRQPLESAGQLRFGGLNALEAKLANSHLYPGTPEAVAEALLEIADWNLMFLSFGRAMDVYESALEHMRLHGATDDQVAALFSPETPVPLPAFVPNASVYRELSDVRGYVDVEVEINRFGGVRDVQVLGGSDNASTSIERRLKRFVYQSRFRPRYAAGEWQRNDRFAVRYEFGYSSS